MTLIIDFGVFGQSAPRRQDTGRGQPMGQDAKSRVTEAVIPHRLGDVSQIDFPKPGLNYGARQFATTSQTPQFAGDGDDVIDCGDL